MLGTIVPVCIICLQVFMYVCVCIVGTPFYFTPYMDRYRGLCFLIPLLSVLYRHVLCRRCVIKQFRIILGDLCILPNIINSPWGVVPNIVRWSPLVHLILFGLMVFKGRYIPLYFASVCFGLPGDRRFIGLTIHIYIYPYIGRV